MKNRATKPINTGANGRFYASLLATLALTACQQIPQKVVVDFGLHQLQDYIFLSIY